MSILRIALLQISPCGGTEANLVKGLECCRKAKEMGADIALFPEMWSNGYGIFGRGFEEWSGEAIPADGEFVAELDLDMLRRYRESEVHGNAYRRPKKYSLLTSTEISPPFVRSVRISRAGVYLKPALVEAAHAAVKSTEKQPYYRIKFEL